MLLSHYFEFCSFYCHSDSAFLDFCLRNISLEISACVYVFGMLLACRTLKYKCSPSVAKCSFISNVVLIYFEEGFTYLFK